MKIEITLNGKTKETEKAYCLNVCVSWNGNFHSKDLWFPKSVCDIFTADYDGNRLHAMVDDWFIKKAEKANSFNGYEMNFETAFRG